MFKWIRTKDLGFHPPTASESLKGTRYLSWLHCLYHKGQKLQRSFHHWSNSPATKVTWQFRLAVNHEMPYKCSKCTRDTVVVSTKTIVIVVLFCCLPWRFMVLVFRLSSKKRPKKPCLYWRWWCLLLVGSWKISRSMGKPADSHGTTWRNGR